MLSSVLGPSSSVAGNERPVCHFVEPSPSSLLFADEDPQSAGTDAMIQSWNGLQSYAFPPFSLLQHVITKVRQSRGLEFTLIASFWPQHPWFLDFLKLLVAVPVFLPRQKDLLRQPHFHRFHQNLPVLRLTAYRISSDPPAPSVSFQRWLGNLLVADAPPPE